MNLPRNSRMGPQRLRFTGHSHRCAIKGKEIFSLTGNSWFEPSPNSHRKDENPLEQGIIYQAPSDSELLVLQGSIAVSSENP